MSTEVNKGDRVKVTIEGRISSEELPERSFCRKVTDDTGTNHFVYFSGGAEVEVIAPAENFKAGQAYRSALGYVYIRTATGWVDEDCTRKDDYPKRPMLPLVAETTVTEDVLKSKLRASFRAHGDYLGRLTESSVPRLVSAVKSAGVKVAP